MKIELKGRYALLCGENKKGYADECNDNSNNSDDDNDLGATINIFSNKLMLADVPIMKK